jgi:hypothetical protein
MQKIHLFIVPRVGHLKTLAWHLFEEVKHGNLIHITSDKDNLINIEKYIPLEIKKNIEFVDISRSKINKYDCIYNVSIFCDIFDLNALNILKNNSKKMIAIDHNGEGYLLYYRKKPLPKFFWDIVETQKDFLLDEYNVILSTVSKKVIIGSFPQLNFKLDNCKFLRDKYGIPNGKKVVLFSPPQTTSQSTIKYKNLIRKIRNFWFMNNRLGKLLWPIHKLKNSTFNYFDYKFFFRKLYPGEDWFFVLKVRDKTTILEQDYNYYDLVISDEDFFPHTTIELIKISSLVVGYSSSITIDALAHNKSSIYIEQYKDFSRYGFDKWQGIRDEEVFIGRLFKNKFLDYVSSSQKKNYIVNILKNAKYRASVKGLSDND